MTVKLHFIIRKLLLQEEDNNATRLVTGRLGRQEHTLFINPKKSKGIIIKKTFLPVPAEILFVDGIVWSLLVIVYMLVA